MNSGFNFQLEKYFLIAKHTIKIYESKWNHGFWKILPIKMRWHIYSNVVHYLNMLPISLLILFPDGRGVSKEVLDDILKFTTSLTWKVKKYGCCHRTWYNSLPQAWGWGKLLKGNFRVFMVEIINVVSQMRVTRTLKVVYFLIHKAGLIDLISHSNRVS